VGSARVSKRRVTEAKPKSIYKTSSSAPPAASNAGFDYWRSNHRERQDHQIQFKKMNVKGLDLTPITPNYPPPKDQTVEAAVSAANSGERTACPPWWAGGGFNARAK